MAAFERFIRQGTVLQGAQPWSNLNINPTFRGQILLDDGSIVQAFIKDLNPKQLANELFAAAMGRFADLPIPVPILATVDPGVIPATALRLPDSDQHLVFASTDAESATVVQVIRAAPSGSNALRHLANWSQLGRLYGFDAWLANVDRHANNLLLSGSGAVWMIDHGHCFSGPEWVAGDLEPSKEYPNRLREWMTPELSDDQKTRAAGSAASVAMGMNDAEIEAVGARNFVANVLSEDEFAAAVGFLSNREAYIQSLASSALEILV